MICSLHVGSKVARASSFICRPPDTRNLPESWEVEAFFGCSSDEVIVEAAESADTSLLENGCAPQRRSLACYGVGHLEALAKKGTHVSVADVLKRVAHGANEETDQETEQEIHEHTKAKPQVWDAFLLSLDSKYAQQASSLLDSGQNLLELHPQVPLTKTSEIGSPDGSRFSPTEEQTEVRFKLLQGKFILLALVDPTVGL